jgi:hypothetical protein
VDTSTLILLPLFIVLVVLYTARRRARLRKD